MWVEILYGGQWGTVCDDSWDMADAHVVCRQLGFSAATNAWQSAHFGQGTGQILMDDVNCVGDEQRLQECAFRGWGLHNCRHYEDAAVTCDPDECDRHNRSLFSSSWFFKSHRSKSRNKTLKTVGNLSMSMYNCLPGWDAFVGRHQGVPEK